VDGGFLDNVKLKLFPWDEAKGFLISGPAPPLPDLLPNPLPGYEGERKFKLNYQAVILIVPGSQERPKENFTPTA
jgi:hypothetical protein